ncbi:MAG: helix-turn-helix domain-containing protein [Candidatus Omnitrophica bacterium]|nr:helix-turn-helix domain-containing protein [Candidatus Omnitrophota bacterium]
MTDFKELLAHVRNEIDKLDKAAGDDLKKKQEVIGEKVRFYRKANHLTIEEFAKRMYVTKMAVIRWEKGEVRHSESTMARFRELGVLDKE